MRSDILKKYMEHATTLVVSLSPPTPLLDLSWLVIFNLSTPTITPFYTTSLKLHYLKPNPLRDVIDSNGYKKGDISAIISFQLSTSN